MEYWNRNNPNNYKKIQDLVKSIRFDPFRGIGKVKRLSGDKKVEGLYSRRINKQDRLVYEVDGEKIILLSCRGHYKQEKRKSNRVRTHSKR